MTIDFYCVIGGGPSRAVLLTAKAIGVDLNPIEMDLSNEEHLKPEFIKINPQHIVPTIVDNGFALWESRAIMQYLQNQYGKDDTLYPKDPKKRAIVDQRLQFDLGTLYAKFADYLYPVAFYGAESFEPEKLEKLHEAVKFLDVFLTDSEYAAGDNLTLADLSLVATVSSFEAIDYDFTPYKNVSRWYEKVKTTAVAYEEANAKNLVIFKQMVEEGSSKK